VLNFPQNGFSPILLRHVSGPRQPLLKTFEWENTASIFECGNFKERVNMGREKLSYSCGKTLFFLAALIVCSNGTGGCPKWRCPIWNNFWDILIKALRSKEDKFEIFSFYLVF